MGGETTLHVGPGVSGGGIGVSGGGIGLKSHTHSNKCYVFVAITINTEATLSNHLRNGSQPAGAAELPTHGRTGTRHHDWAPAKAWSNVLFVF